MRTSTLSSTHKCFDARSRRLLTRAFEQFCRTLARQDPQWLGHMIIATVGSGLRLVDLLPTVERSTVLGLGHADPKQEEALKASISKH